MITFFCMDLIMLGDTLPPFPVPARTQLGDSASSVGDLAANCGDPDFPANFGDRSGELARKSVDF